MTRAELRRRWPWVFASLSMALTWILLAWRSEPEPGTDQQRLNGFPLELSGWAGRERRVPERERELLRASELLLRDYQRTLVTEPDSAAPISLFVAFYESQRTGATYHSPQNCLPGAGWQITQLDVAMLDVADGEPARVNQVVIQKGLEQQVVYYWYQDRGRILASEYWAKYYMVYDALTKNRSDGSLVRVSAHVQGDLAATKSHLRDFITEMWKPLTTVLPGKSLALVKPRVHAPLVLSEQLAMSWRVARPGSVTGSSQPAAPSLGACTMTGCDDRLLAMHGSVGRRCCLQSLLDHG